MRKTISLSEGRIVVHFLHKTALSGDPKRSLIHMTKEACSIVKDTDFGLSQWKNWNKGRHGLPSTSMDLLLKLFIYSKDNSKLN